MSPRLVVHAGGSLREGDAQRLGAVARRRGIELVRLPPIVRGELRERAADEGWDTRVLILDGEFGQSLSIAVLEVREHLAAGHYLAGASSIGALRAVECEALGMVRHGWIAEQYASGAIDSDADLALVMAPDTFTPLTVPLINVRWLVRVLIAERALDPEAGAEVVRAAAALHYRDRLPKILARHLRQTLPAATFAPLAPQLEPEALPAWNRKELDGALAVRAEIAALTAGPGQPVKGWYAHVP